MALTAAAPVQAAPEAVQAYGDPAAPARLLVRGTTDIALFDPVLRLFTASHPDLRIDYEQWASNDLYDLAVAACNGTARAADLLVSSAVDQQVKLVNDGCAQPHASPATAALPAASNWRNEVFGITREPAVIVYNRALVPPDEAPASRFGLIDLLRAEDGRYDGRIATYDIEQSGLGYLFAFADSQQATTFGSVIEAFARVHAVTTCCSAELIDGVASGKYLIAYNVLGSYALDRAAKDPNIAVVAPSDYTLVLARAALIPSRAANPQAAGALIDFLVSEPGRQVLRAQHLFLDASDLRDSGLLGSESGISNLRPIPLSPVLLVGLDSQRRKHFIALWRDAFSGR
ncbi:extracellular solute-binding protein [bacterium]|nr:extracellular solute-binding protein [bacterium]